MGLTIQLNDAKPNISNGTNLVYVQTDTTGVYNFKILLEITYQLDSSYPSETTKTVSFTQSLNQNGNQAIFNLSNIYRTIVTPMIYARGKADAPNTTTPNQYSSIHNLPYYNATTSRMFSWSLVNDDQGLQTFRGNANVITLKFYEYYSTTATGIATKQTSTLVTKNIFLLYGRGKEEDGVVISFDDYILSGTSKFLLNSNYNTKTNQYGHKFVKIGKNDYHTLSFFNRCAINTTAEPYQILITYFNVNGASLGTLTILNNSTSGGGYYATASEGTDESFIMHFGAGLENLQKIDTTESAYTGTLPDDVTGGRDAIKSYSIRFKSSTNYDMSETYVFEVVDYCDRYEQNRIAFTNRFGVWEYMTLNKEVEHTMDIDRETITKPVISQASTLTPFLSGEEYLNSAYPLDVAKQGEMVSNIKVKEKLKLFTDNLLDWEVDMIKDMMMSEQIHLVNGENAKALILENTNMRLRGDKDTGQFQYELTFRYANLKNRT